MSSPGIGPRTIELEDRVTEHLQMDAARLEPQQTIAEALASLRAAEPAHQIVYFYVVGDDGRLLGVVPTRRLLMSPLDATVGELMITDLVTISEDATVLDACVLFAERRLLALPVVDSEQRLLGLVYATLFTDEIHDIAAKQSVDDIFQLIGIHVARGRQVTPWSGFRDRFPWLLSNITGGLLCALLSSRYEGLLAQVLLLALFIPVVLAVSESVSIQSMTLTLQSFHLGPASHDRLLRALGQELATAVMLGLATGGTVALAAWLWRGEVGPALAIGGSIVAAMVTACLLGVLLPTAVRALGRDPSIAAGPMVLATTDLAALLFYFNLAGAMLG